MLQLSTPTPHPPPRPLLDCAQYTYKTVNISGASQACVSAPSYAWTHVFVGATVAECPVAFDWLAGPGNLVLVDSVLGSGLGPAAIVLGGGSVNGAVLQNVQLLQSSAGNATAWVVQVRRRTARGVLRSAPVVSRRSVGPPSGGAWERIDLRATVAVWACVDRRRARCKCLG